jgi:hypothetical protein
MPQGPDVDLLRAWGKKEAFILASEKHSSPLLVSHLQKDYSLESTIWKDKFNSIPNCSLSLEMAPCNTTGRPLASNKGQMQTSKQPLTS